MTRRLLLSCLVVMGAVLGPALADDLAFAAKAAPRLRTQAITPDASIQSMVAAVSNDTVYKHISQLCGYEPVVIGGELDTLLTRYAYNWRFDLALQYIYEHFQDCGLDVAYHQYVVSLFDFHGTSFCDATNGWAVGSTGKVFRTSDGGATWVKQPIYAGTTTTLHGVGFADSLSGWVVGDGGKIFRSANGGAAWAPQTSGTTLGLREVLALDAQNAWVVGLAGTILRTTDGGANWTGVPAGVSEDFYGCHFRSNSRGWVVGEGGVIRFWDGSTMTGQASGTGESLEDVCFVSDSVGWAVGGGWTVLKTVDGGLNWASQAVPTDLDPGFAGVCFADSLEGWVVGSNGTILHTTDSGATWQVKLAGTLSGLSRVKVVGPDTLWIVGANGTILHTDDGGATWAKQCGNLPAANVRRLKNVVATKPGTASTDQVIICAHADDYSPDYNNFAPGADDNASGTAAVLEAARVLAGSGFEKTIKFIAWSAEEYGGHGSREYVGEAKARGDVISGALNFDMIGYVSLAPEDADLICNDPSMWLADLAAACAEAYVPGLPTVTHRRPNLVLSDYYMFWQAGYEAVGVDDDEPMTYPYWHTVNDTLGNVTIPFCSDVIRMGIATIAELAGPDVAAVVASEPQAVVAVSCRPNPFERSAQVTFGLGSESPVKAGIYDVAGRRVRSLCEATLRAGRHAFAWAGDDDAGARAAPGLYFAKVETPAGVASAKIILLR